MAKTQVTKVAKKKIVKMKVAKRVEKESGKVLKKKKKEGMKAIKKKIVKETAHTMSVFKINQKPKRKRKAENILHPKRIEKKNLRPEIRKPNSTKQWKKSLHAAELKAKERKLALDLFGDYAEVMEDKDEECEENMLDSVGSRKEQKIRKENDDRKENEETNIPEEDRKENEETNIPEDDRKENEETNIPEDDRKENEETNIPEDPFDVHHMEVSEPENKPAWIDEDDENIRVLDIAANMTKARGQRGVRETSEKKYELELREKFSQVIGSTPEWADLSYKPKEESDNDDDMLKRTGNYLSGSSSSRLPKKVLEYKQMSDVNSSYSEGALIKAIEFHPKLQIALVAGSVNRLGSAATLFQVDGNVNHRIHSVRFPGFPISSACFTQDGQKFVVGSNMHNHFFVYDMETSNEKRLTLDDKFEKGVKKNVYISPDGELLIYLGSKGQIFIYDVATLSLIDMLEAPHPLTCATFNSDGSKMYTHGLTGEVCIWDMLARECIHKFYDAGCISSQSIAMSPNNQYLACGSRSGIVNIYDAASLSTSSPAPVKVLFNLTTSVTSLTFNASSEMLAMASSDIPNALKLIHFPSMTCFQNFPKSGNTLRRFEAVQFSPQSGYFAVGNHKGTVPLYRLKHFTTY